jgi:hypothetical protein
MFINNRNSTEVIGSEATLGRFSGTQCELFKATKHSGSDPIASASHGRTHSEKPSLGILDDGHDEHSK